MFLVLGHEMKNSIVELVRLIENITLDLTATASFKAGVQP
jgi:hypothetical protein